MAKHHTLKNLAAALWFIGGIVLFAKGSLLLAEANGLRPGNIHTWLAGGLGLLIGVFKARYLFIRIGLQNLSRIESLRQPHLWQFFRGRFFLFLAAMVLLGAALSRFAAGHYACLLSVAMLDWSIAIALIGSGHIYWARRRRPRA
jgi:hypothetical protein